MSLAWLFLVGCLALAPAAAQASSGPLIERISASHVTQHEATLEAQINPQGSETGYEIWVWPGCSAGACERLPPRVVAKAADIGDGYEGRVVIAEVHGLEPGVSNNEYWVVASNAVGSTESPHESFATPPEPSIEGESVSYVTHNDATLEARINPEGLPDGVDYQFQVVKNTSEYLPELVCAEMGVVQPVGHDGCGDFGDTEPPGAIPLRHISTSAEGKPVSLDLASVGVTLQPDTTYHYRVLAAESRNGEDGVTWEAPAVIGTDHTFTTRPPSTPPSELVTGLAEPTPSGYKLKGKLNPDGLPTTYYYEYIGSNEVECLDIEPGLERCWHETAHVGPITGDTQQEVPPIEVTGLTVGVTYYYRLVANNADGTVFGNEATFTVTAKGAPSEVVTEPAEATSNGFRLKGKLNPDGLPTTYYFQYASVTCDEGCTSTKTAVVGPLAGDTQEEVPAIEVTDLTAGQYWYRLVASNADGVEGGAFVMFTIPPERQNGPSGQAKQEPKSEPPTPLVTPLTAIPSPNMTIKPKPLTKAQKLANALKACERKPKQRRASCEKQARKQYGKATKKTG
jgi:hypothetical protein